jgi:rhodanese-related sulfurtransferase
VPRAQLEATVGKVVSVEALRQVIVYNDDGKLGRLAAKTLTEMGYPEVVNLDGGLDQWRAQGLPIDDAPVEDTGASGPAS